MRGGILAGFALSHGCITDSLLPVFYKDALLAPLAFRLVGQASYLKIMPYVWRFEVALLVTLFVELSPTFAALHGKLVGCSALSSALPEKVSYPGNATYGSSVDSYWFQEARLLPSCIISPTSASDVALIVKTLSGHGTKHSSLPKFAIRSGGHTPFAGAANIEDGITIDLRAMNVVSLNPDRTIASAGAGSNWDDIYKMLQPMNLTVVGGRVAGIGVGGLTTGGLLAPSTPSLSCITYGVIRWYLLSLPGTGFCMRQYCEHRGRPRKWPDIQRQRASKSGPFHRAQGRI